MQDFLRKCLHKDPLKRATIDELLRDPFVNCTIYDIDESTRRCCMLAMEIFSSVYNKYVTRLTTLRDAVVALLNEIVR